jgi:hypothetical protein
MNASPIFDEKNDLNLKLKFPSNNHKNVMKIIIMGNNRGKIGKKKAKI